MIKTDKSKLSHLERIGYEEWEPTLLARADVLFYSGIPIFRTFKGNENWFEKSGVTLQRFTEEGKRLLVRVIERFEKLRVREIGIPPLFISLTNLF